MKKDFSIVIGRFQPFHNGHQSLINHALDQANEVVICLGSSFSPRTIKNPWTYDERVHMIREVFPNAPLRFVPIRDYHYNDEKWTREVRNRVFEIVGDKKAVLVGHKKDATSYYLDLFPEFEFCPPPIVKTRGFEDGAEFINATDIRNHIFKAESWSHLVPEQLDPWELYTQIKHLQQEYDFIKAYKEAWKDAPYHPTFLTVDSVVNDDGHILLVQRATEPGKGLWALPGGFVNQSEYLIDAAIREVKEETNVDLSKKDMVQYDIFDYPSRSLRGRTITTAYYFKTKGNIKAKAADDAKNAFFIAITDIYRNEEKFFEDHFSIITKFLEKE